MGLHFFVFGHTDKLVFKAPLVYHSRPSASMWITGPGFDGRSTVHYTDFRGFLFHDTKNMIYTPQNFESLLGMQGFSDQLLKNHFTLYEGYVKNTNALLEKIPTLAAGTPEFNELSRRLGWEFNGMRLHELYFNNMTRTPDAPGSESTIARKIVASFGSMDKIRESIKNTGQTRGIGWVVVYYDPKADHLFTVWIDDLATNHLAGCVPVLIMDMWEHAFMLDYQLKKADYIDSFVANINWAEVNQRLENVLR